MNIFFAVSTYMAWFVDISNYIVKGKLRAQLHDHEKHKIINKSYYYSWITDDFFYTGADLIIRWSVKEEEVPDILRVCHNETCGGNFSYKNNYYKVSQAIYYWTTLFKEEKIYVHLCDNCQRVGRVV